MDSVEKLLKEISKRTRWAGEDPKDATGELLISVAKPVIAKYLENLVLIGKIKEFDHGTLAALCALVASEIGSKWRREIPVKEILSQIPTDILEHFMEKADNMGFAVCTKTELGKRAGTVGDWEWKAGSGTALLKIHPPIGSDKEPLEIPLNLND